ncbi:hypothetical protein G5V58_15520 [Nocardioides anomalus]|uniref:Uncharacterized protein n=1 Tax=Nocardioides anomalus TaxID=2712223 RepID=A0A6G6WFI5_9ACTN|nr:hypothetical protein [Nocardioides anomalus]QIG43994.1 hypothetical protein G5V58_15520 [Nocardioides anomalus]
MVSTLGLVAAGTGAAGAATHQHQQRGSTGYTQVVVAPEVYALIGSVGITPAPVEGAKALAFQGTLAARFPITGFRLSSLQIRH